MRDGSTQAAESYDAALALDPEHADAHFYLAVTLEKLERSADARPHWESVSAPGAGRRVGGAGEGVYGEFLMCRSAEVPKC